MRDPHKREHAQVICIKGEARLQMTVWRQTSSGARTKTEATLPCIAAAAMPFTSSYNSRSLWDGPSTWSSFGTQVEPYTTTAPGRALVAVEFDLRCRTCSSWHVGRERGQTGKCKEYLQSCCMLLKRSKITTAHRLQKRCSASRLCAKQAS